MYRKERKWICIILVFCMVISMMGFDQAAFDSFFQNTTIEDCAHINGKSLTLRDKNNDMCLVDLFGLKKTGENIAQEARHLKNASGTEVFFGTLFFCNILLWKGKFLRKLRVTDSVETTMMHCIIRYIHERGEYKSVCLL